MSTMKATTLLLLHACLALSSAQNSITPPNVLEAISICREKLKEDPHFPRIQYALAQLLDSQITPPVNHIDDTNLVGVHEVLRLYHAVGQPSVQVIEKRRPPIHLRYESLIRAATIAKDILHDKLQAIEYYNMAMNLDGIDNSSILLAFQTIMPMLLSLVNNVDQRIEITIELDGTMQAVDSPTQNQLIQNAFNACNLLEKKCPTEYIVDEYRGATLRIIKQPELAYQSYHQAMEKSKQCLNGGEGESDQMLLANFVRTSILVAAAAREAGYGFQTQMSYLLDAEKVIAPVLISSDKQSDTLRDRIVDLYNNMGIAEKKQGSIKKARDYFRESLEINPSDGHAIVQLASIADGSDVDDVFSNVQELDPDYVSALFDGYSSRFESELVDVLGYKGHSLVYDVLRKSLNRIGKSPLSIKRIIDLGCGTGLLGDIVSNEMPWVIIEGVDLSQRMVEIARERKSKRGRNVYATVTNEDAAKYLSALEKGSIDCILASDVFIYIGDISKVFEQSWVCLVSGGIVGFTVEKYDGPYSDSGLRLLPSGRFGHSRSYIEDVANRSGFEVLSWEDCTLRQQGGKDVRGSSVILRKIQ